ncbi:MAG: sugar phosphate isomerase/epimerase [Methanocorpusculum sp.]|nr:sugar phosphate isomerase/epimerase [Methanocorpusculum sp.]
MPLSISTHCLSSLTLDEALETLALHTSHVEVMNDGRHYIESAEPLLSHSFTYSIHAPARSVNIASVLEPIRRASEEIICDSIELAVAADAKTVVFHPGYYAFTEEYEKAVSSLKKSLEAINEYAEDAGVTACVENMGNWGYFFLKGTEDVSLISKTPFCLDIGHANECGTLDAFLDVPFMHIHVHDNDGKSDTHAALGDGNIDISKVAEAIKKFGVECPVIECGTLEASLASAKVLEELL